MSRIFAFWFIFFFGAILSAQQVSIKGRVVIHNSKFNTGNLEYVPQATIRAPFSKGAQTDGEGKFELEFVGISPGTRISLSCEKYGLEVVNTRDLENVVLGSEFEVPIYLIASGGLAEAQVELYQISKEALFSRRDDMIRQLREEGADREALLLALEEKYGREIKDLKEAEELLRAEIEQLERQLPEFAMQLARQNLDFASDLYIKAYQYFIRGEIDAVIATLSADQLDQINQNIEDALRESDALEEKARELRATARRQFLENIENYNLKAEAYLLKFDYDQVIAIYQKILDLNQEGIQDELIQARYSQKLGMYYLWLSETLRNSQANSQKETFQLYTEKGKALLAQSIQIWEEMELRGSDEQATAFAEMGERFFQMSGEENEDQGFALLLRALDIIIEKEQGEEVQTVTQATIFALVGHVYLRYAYIHTGEDLYTDYYERGRSFYTLAVKTAEELEDDRLIAEICFQYGQEYPGSTLKEELLKKSLLHYSYLKNPNRAFLGEVNAHLGQTLKDRKTKEAKHYFLESVEAYTRVQRNTSQSLYFAEQQENYFHLAEVYARLEQTDSAHFYLGKYVHSDQWKRASSSYVFFGRYIQAVDFCKTYEMRDSAVMYQRKYWAEIDTTKKLDLSHVYNLEGFIETYHSWGMYEEEMDGLEYLLENYDDYGSEKYRRVYRLELYYKLGVAHYDYLLEEDAKRYFQLFLDEQFFSEVDQESFLQRGKVYAYMARISQSQEDYNWAYHYWKLHLKLMKKYDESFTRENKKKIKNRIRQMRKLR